MVSTSILTAMVLMVAGLLALAIYFKKRYKISLAMLGTGALSFMIATQFFERILHVIVLRPDATGASYLVRDFPILYVIYGVLAAAIFEETARYLVFRFIGRKRQLEFKDALAYGLGHGGVEMIVVGLLSLVNLFVLYQVIAQNPAQLEGLLPEDMIASVRNTPVWTPLVLVLERFLALAAQLMLTIWVFKAVTDQNTRLFLAALGFHALLDLAPAMSQVGWLSSPVLVEILVFIVVLIIGYFTRNLLQSETGTD